MNTSSTRRRRTRSSTRRRQTLFSVRQPSRKPNQSNLRRKTYYEHARHSSSLNPQVRKLDYVIARIDSKDYELAGDLLIPYVDSYERSNKKGGSGSRKKNQKGGAREIQYRGYTYMALNRADGNSTDNSLPIQPMSIPEGFEIAPGDFNDVYVANRLRWGADFILFSDSTITGTRNLMDNMNRDVFRYHYCNRKEPTRDLELASQNGRVYVERRHEGFNMKCNVLLRRPIDGAAPPPTDLRLTRDAMKIMTPLQIAKNLTARIPIPADNVDSCFRSVFFILTGFHYSEFNPVCLRGWDEFKRLHYAPYSHWPPTEEDVGWFMQKNITPGFRKVTIGYLRRNPDIVNSINRTFHEMWAESKYIPNIDTWAESEESEFIAPVVPVAPAPAPAPAPVIPPSIVEDQSSVRTLDDGTRLVQLYGSQPLTVHAPVWWHKIMPVMLSEYESTQSQWPQGRIFAERRAINVSDFSNLRPAMKLFCTVVNSYSNAVHIPMQPPMEQNDIIIQELTDIVRRELNKKIVSCNYSSIPSTFASDDTHLTFCEFAAILFFTQPDTARVGRSFSTYSMLRSSMCYNTAKDLTGQMYCTNILCQSFIVIFYSALKKCPPIGKIFSRGLLPPPPPPPLGPPLPLGLPIWPPPLKYLHRFLPVPQEVYEHYAQYDINSIVTFYCFQSFSLHLNPNNVGPFTQPTRDKTHLILLRILINAETSARYISHYSAVEHEEEILSLPCTPYMVSERVHFNHSHEFRDLLHRDTGFYHADITFHGFQSYIIMTLIEEHDPRLVNIASILNG